MCLTAFAPGTSGPSIAVVRKILFPQTIGDEWPRPAIGVFHLIFLVALHVLGRSFSSEIPCPEGPLHCGQLVPAKAPAEFSNSNVEIAMITKAMLTRLSSFHFYSFKWAGKVS